GGAKGDLGLAEAARRQKESGEWMNSGSAVYDVCNSNLLWMSNSPPPGLQDYPVVLIKISDARQFCEWLGRRYPALGTFRLPTVEEWMLAAYGNSRNYPWGEKWNVKIPCVSASCEEKRRAP